MGLNRSIKNLKFDTRMLDWNKKNGVISDEDYNQHLNSLPDSASNAAEVNLDEKPARSVLDEQDMVTPPNTGDSGTGGNTPPYSFN